MTPTNQNAAVYMVGLRNNYNTGPTQNQNLRHILEHEYGYPFRLIYQNNETRMS
jgi:hypothetical protein